MATVNTILEKEAYISMFGHDSDSDESEGSLDVEDDRFWEESDTSETEPSELNGENIEINRNNPITMPDIPGLVYYPEFFNHLQQSKMMESIIEEQYFSTPGMNQAMRFGELPNCLTWVMDSLKSVPGIFPEPIMTRTPLFDQTIINLYRKGDGIKSHVDLARFEDGIVIISLLSSCIMTFRPASTHPSPDSVHNEEILLKPGDVLSLSGMARYHWEHGIPEREFDIVEGSRVERGTRISVTFRRLIKSCCNGLAE